MIWTAFNARFFAQFPHLEEHALKMFDYFDDEEPGHYLIFETILQPRLDDVAETDDHEFKRLMRFVEQTAVDDSNLVYIGLGEPLPSLRNANRIRAEAGPITLRAIEVAERTRIQHIRDRESSPLLDGLMKLLNIRGKKK
ncbi:hypothetical protein [Terriglobus roseus]|uniref:Uncharacterized protein n=1 Tax=Terriglobus roseus TaxID=392734 RepID=A0A1G7ESA1_9BACT|nr:hypothetical protein [Terriglobus roseus]SDE66499.1 hypothetical protein SAMN05444167_0077 [Terriglobus roseus]